MNRHERHADSDSKHATAAFTMPFGMDITGLMYQPAFAAMADVNGRLYAGLVELNKEWADFVNRRLRDDFTLRGGSTALPGGAFRALMRADAMSLAVHAHGWRVHPA
jgi:hypothetical protein